MSKTITLEERVDMNRFTAIMNNLTYYDSKIGGGYVNCEVIKGEAYHTILKNYYNKINSEGKCVTKYHQRTNCGKRKIGRYCADGSLSQQNISRPVRHTLVGHLLWDVDIVNCHPVIALQLCQKHGINTPILKHYIENRKDCLQIIINELDITRDQAKKEFLRALNGGHMKDDFAKSKFLSSFFSESSRIREGLEPHFQDIYNAAIVNCKKKKKNSENVLGTAVNYVFCHYENEMLQVMKRTAEHLDLVVRVLAFDGLMIDKDGVARKYLEDVYFPACIKAISDEVGFNVAIVVKDPDEAIEINPDHLPKEGEEKPVFDVVDAKVVKYWESEKVEPDQTVTSRYIDTSVIPDERLVAIKGNMGSGKTFGLIEKFENQRILIVSYRCSLDVELARKFNCKLYSDFNQSHINCDRLVVQIDSVWRACGSYDVVILDEVGYTLNHLFEFAKEKSKCLDALKHHLSESKNIVMMDALLQKRHIECVKQFANIEKCFVIKNDFKVYSDYKVTMIDGQRFELLNQVRTALNSGKKVCVPSNSLEALKFVDANIKKEFHGVKTLVIDKDTTSVDSSKWNSYDVVMYTPTIEAGVSYDNLYFHKTIAFATNRSNNPANFCQQLLRVRSLIDKEIVIVCSMSSEKALPLTIDGIIEDMETDCQAMYLSGLDFNYGAKAVSKDTFFNRQYFQMKIGVNHDRREFKHYIKNMLIEHGMTVNGEEKVVFKKEEMDELDCVKENADILESERIFNSRVLSTDEFEALELNIKNSEDDIRAMKRYKCERTYGFPGMNLTEFVNLFDMQKEFINHKLVIGGENWLVEQLNRRGEEMKDVTNDDWDFLTIEGAVKACKPVVKALFTLRLMRELGFDLVQLSKQKCSDGIVIDSKKLVDFIKANEEQFLSITKTRKDISKLTSTDSKSVANISKTIKGMVESCGFKWKSERQQCKGERQNYTSLSNSFFFNGIIGGVFSR